MKVILDGIELSVRKNIKISYLIKNHRFYYKAILNDNLVDLDEKIIEPSVIKLLDLTSYTVMRSYEATIRFLIMYVINKLKINEKYRFNYTVSRGLFLYMRNSKLYIEMIESELKNVIKENKIIKKLDENYYELDGFKAWMNFDLLKKTGMVKRYKLHFHDIGIIIQFPRSELNGNIPILSDSTKYFNLLTNSLIDVLNKKIDTIDKLNKVLENTEKINEFESEFKNKINNITDDIIKNNKKIILITGPSSSGKTTLAELIEKNIKRHGKETFLISIDDYYKSRIDAVLDENGNYDFETTEAFDYIKLNKDLSDLLELKETRLNKYNFLTGLSSLGNAKKITKDTIIILEGIHALNDKFSDSISDELKYKIFISPQCLINIDDYNPIAISDIRLLRRSVRDYKHRKSDINDTLSMWEKVRIGEYKYIYPFQDSSDVTLNTFLPYELNVIKIQALKLFKDTKKQKFYFRTKSLEKMLKMLKTIDEAHVPSDSLLNEFIK